MGIREVGDPRENPAQHVIQFAPVTEFHLQHRSDMLVCELGAVRDAGHDLWVHHVAHHAQDARMLSLLFCGCGKKKKSVVVVVAHHHHMQTTTGKLEGRCVFIYISTVEILNYNI